MAGKHESDQRNEEKKNQSSPTQCMAYTWLPGKVASIKTYTYYARRNYQCSQVKYRQNQDNIVQH